MSRLVDFHKGGENQMSTLSCSASKEREREDFLLAANLRCSSYILLPPLSTLLVHLASVISRRAKATQVFFVIMCRQHRLWLFSFFLSLLFHRSLRRWIICTSIGCRLKLLCFCQWMQDYLSERVLICNSLVAALKILDLTVQHNNYCSHSNLVLTWWLFKNYRSMILISKIV